MNDQDSKNNETQYPDISHYMDHPPSPLEKPHSIAVVEEIIPLNKTENRDDQTPNPAPPFEKPKSEENKNSPNESSVDQVMDRQVKRGPNKTLLVIATLLFILLAAFGAFIYFQTKKENQVNVAIPNQEMDSDGDLLPDNLEMSTGLNPNVAEFTRCSSGKSCADESVTPDLAQKQNVLIILDSSSSMGLLLDGETKMDTVKKALVNYLTQAENNSEVQIGLAVYGNKGSDSDTDKVISCASAEIVADLGSFTASTANGYLNKIEPLGWSPIGLSLTLSQEVFADKENANNQIIVISDGAENCNTSPVQAAKKLYESPQKIIVNVIGFNVTPSDADSLSEIASAGGGSFQQADSISSLTNIFQTEGESFSELESEDSCTTAYLDTINQCIYETVKILNNYASQNADDSSNTLEIIDTFSKSMYSKLEELRNSIGV